MCILVYKILNHHLPDWLFDISTVNEIRGTNTRQTNDLFVTRTNTLTGTKMLMVRGPLVWNTIPSQVKNTGSLPVFKERLKKYLLHKQR